MRTAQIVSKGMYGIFDVSGPIVEFLTSPEEPGAVFCLMKGPIPAGVPAPLHVRIPGGTKHALRNTSREPVAQLITTTPTRENVFGRSADRSRLEQCHYHRRPRTFCVSRGLPPSTVRIPEENAAVGISLFRDPTREAALPVNPC
jgi:hypothetical protein